jgi:pyruvate,orthophosphate dikinase
VVGATGIGLEDNGFTSGGRRFAVGDPITIDGSTGEVFEGVLPGDTAVAPEATVLLDWARQAGIEVPRPPAAAAPDAAPDAEAAAPERPTAAGEVAVGPLSREDVLAVLLVKGYATAEAVAAALLATSDAATAALDQLLAAGLAEEAVGSIRLTEAGKRAAGEAVERAAAAWGRPAAEAALDAFLTLDARMKVTVTAWQMRDAGGQQAINDHTDAAYDGRVLADLAALHADAAAWLQPLVDGLPRLATYAARLERANAAAQAGDGRFVASPRVDSYHSAWFELHEDLILHAGRTRADEVAAGRA